ncbi:hypothetical protein OROMI_009931 [Orobanche minor]
MDCDLRCGCNRHTLIALKSRVCVERTAITPKMQGKRIMKPKKHERGERSARKRADYIIKKKAAKKGKGIADAIEEVEDNEQDKDEHEANPRWQLKYEEWESMKMKVDQMQEMITKLYFVQFPH